MSALMMYLVPPDDTALALERALGEREAVARVLVADESVDYDRLLDRILENDRTITWF
jgi:hypothetical protein